MKRVIRYLKGTIKIGLIFSRELAEQLLRDSLSYRLVRYVDNNFAGDLEDQKSVMGYCFFLNGVMVFWSSKK